MTSPLAQVQHALREFGANGSIGNRPSPFTILSSLSSSSSSSSSLSSSTESESIRDFFSFTTLYPSLRSSVWKNIIQSFKTTFIPHKYIKKVNEELLYSLYLSTIFLSSSSSFSTSVSTDSSDTRTKDEFMDYLYTITALCNQYAGILTTQDFMDLVLYGNRSSLQENNGINSNLSLPTILQHQPPSNLTSFLLSSSSSSSTSEPTAITSATTVSSSSTVSTINGRIDSLTESSIRVSGGTQLVRLDDIIPFVSSILYFYNNLSSIQLTILRNNYYSFHTTDTNKDDQSTNNLLSSPPSLCPILNLVIIVVSLLVRSLRIQGKTSKKIFHLCFSPLKTYSTTTSSGNKKTMDDDEDNFDEDTKKNTTDSIKKDSDAMNQEDETMMMINTDNSASSWESSVTQTGLINLLLYTRDKCLQSIDTIQRSLPQDSTASLSSSIPHLQQLTTALTLIEQVTESILFANDVLPQYTTAIPRAFMVAQEATFNKHIVYGNKDIKVTTLSSNITNNNTGNSTTSKWGKKFDSSSASLNTLSLYRVPVISTERKLFDSFLEQSSSSSSSTSSLSTIIHQTYGVRSLPYLLAGFIRYTKLSENSSFDSTNTSTNLADGRKKRKGDDNTTSTTATLTNTSTNALPLTTVSSLQNNPIFAFATELIALCLGYNETEAETRLQNRNTSVFQSFAASPSSFSDGTGTTTAFAIQLSDNYYHLSVRIRSVTALLTILAESQGYNIHDDTYPGTLTAILESIYRWLMETLHTLRNEWSNDWEIIHASVVPHAIAIMHAAIALSTVLFELNHTIITAAPQAVDVAKQYNVSLYLSKDADNYPQKDNGKNDPIVTYLQSLYMNQQYATSFDTHGLGTVSLLVSLFACYQQIPTFITDDDDADEDSDDGMDNDDDENNTKNGIISTPNGNGIECGKLRSEITVSLSTFLSNIVSIYSRLRAMDTLFHIYHIVSLYFASSECWCTNEFSTHVWLSAVHLHAIGIALRNLPAGQVWDIGSLLIDNVSRLSVNFYDKTKEYVNHRKVEEGEDDEETFLTAAYILRQHSTIVTEYLRQLGPNNTNALRCLHKAVQAVYGIISYVLTSANLLMNHPSITKPNVSKCLDLLLTGSLQLYLAATDVVIVCGSYGSVTNLVPTIYPNGMNHAVFSDISNIGNDILWPFNLYRKAVESAVALPIVEGPVEVSQRGQQEMKEDDETENNGTVQGKGKASSTSKPNPRTIKSVFPSITDLNGWILSSSASASSPDTQEQGLLLCAARLRLIHTLYEMVKALPSITNTKSIVNVARSLASILLRNPSYITPSVVEVCLPYASSDETYAFTLDLTDTPKDTNSSTGLSRPYRTQTLQDARLYELPLLAAYSSRSISEHIRNTVQEFLVKFTSPDSSKSATPSTSTDGNDTVTLSFDAQVCETILRSFKDGTHRKSETVLQLLEAFNQVDKVSVPSSLSVNSFRTTVSQFTNQVYTPLRNLLAIARSLPVVCHEYSALFSLRNDSTVDGNDNNAYSTIVTIINVLSLLFRMTMASSIDNERKKNKSNKKEGTATSDASSLSSSSSSSAVSTVTRMLQTLQESGIRYISSLYASPGMQSLTLSTLKKKNPAPFIKFTSILTGTIVSPSFFSANHEDDFANFITVQATIVSSAIEGLNLGQDVTNSNDKKVSKNDRKSIVNKSFTSWLTDLYPILDTKEGTSTNTTSTPQKTLTAALSTIDHQCRSLQIVAQALIRYLRNQPVESTDKYVYRGMKQCIDTFVASVIQSPSSSLPHVIADLFECLLLLTLHGKEEELSSVDQRIIDHLRALLTNSSLPYEVKLSAQVSIGRILTLCKDTNTVLYTLVSKHVFTSSLVHFYLHQSVLPDDTFVAHLPLHLLPSIGTSFASVLQNQESINSKVHTLGKMLSFTSQLIHIAARNYDTVIFTGKDKVTVGSIEHDTLQLGTQIGRDTLITLFRTLLTLISSTIHTFLDNHNNYASSKPVLAIITFLQSITTNPRFIPLTIADFNLVLLILSAIVQYGSLQIRVTSAFHSGSNVSTLATLSTKKRNMKQLIDQSISVDTTCIDLGGLWKSNTLVDAINFSTNDDDAIIVASGSFYGNQIIDKVQTLSQRSNSLASVPSSSTTFVSSSSSSSSVPEMDTSIFNDQTLQGCGWILYALMKHHSELTLASMATVSTILSTLLGLAFTPIPNRSMQAKLGRIPSLSSSSVSNDGYPLDTYLNSLIRCCELFARQVRVARYHAVQVLARLLDILTIRPLVQSGNTDNYPGGSNISTTLSSSSSSSPNPVTGTLPTRIRAIISPGLFALLDICTSRELQQLYSLLHYRTNARSFLKTLHKEYENTYKYTGKV